MHASVEEKCELIDSPRASTVRFTLGRFASKESSFSPQILRYLCDGGIGAVFLSKDFVFSSLAPGLEIGILKVGKIEGEC